MPAMRFVFVHNHIFKNAGSTVDRVFERAGFANTRIEATPQAPTVYPRAILEAVARDPSIEYVSSHVLRAPRPPDQEHLGFIDITFLRHPIDRLHSIWRYSRQAGVHDFPEPYKKAAFADFVDAVAHSAPAHVHSPQTVTLGNARDFYFPPDRRHLEHAKAVVSDTRFLGVVDLFDASFEVFLASCSALLPPGRDAAALAGPHAAVNTSAPRDEDLAGRLQRIRAEVGERHYAFLERANALDVELFHHARDELLRRRSLLLESGVSGRAAC
jgi:hypothetical protein